MADKEKDESKPLSEEVLEVLYTGQELDEYDRYYTNQADDEIFVGFLGIKFLCQRSGQSFPSKSAFHKHLKAKCVSVQNLVNATSSTQLSSPILVF